MRRTDVCQRRRNCPGDPGLRGQRHSVRDGYRLYDGRRRAVAAGSYDVEKGHDMALDRDILRSDDPVFHSIGIFVQPDSLKLRFLRRSKTLRCKKEQKA